MTATLIDGKAAAAGLRAKVAAEISRLAAVHGLSPALAVVLVGHDPATDWTKTMTSCTGVGFAENVEPQRSLAMPTCRSKANLFLGERDDSDVAGHRLSRWQPDTLPSLQIADGE